MDKLEAYRIIAAQASHGELSFPTNVNASLKIQAALDDPECHIEAAVKLIAAEPLLAARTVAIANSAAYNPAGRDIANVRVAVARLGFRTLRSLLAAMIVKQFSEKLSDPILRVKAAQLWEHSAHVAALSFVIAKRISKVDPETAFFAGIVHEVGGFYLLSRAEEFPGLVDGSAEAWREYGERTIGRGVMKQLGVPADVLKAMEELWSVTRMLPPHTLGDTLRLAKDLAPVATPWGPLDAVTPALDAASATIDFECGAGTLQRVLEESAEEVRSLTAALLMN
ncbi:MAG: HDOD domain-containing protein [Pseudomonadota bacterium]|nr:HDOD domain-containing protein [Pseudomonadota bacterium]